MNSVNFGRWIVQHSQLSHTRTTAAMPGGSVAEHCSSTASQSGTHSSSGTAVGGSARVPKAGNYSASRDSRSQNPAVAREPVAQGLAPGRPINNASNPSASASASASSTSSGALDSRSSAPLSSVLCRMQGHQVPRRTNLCGFPTDSRLLRRSAGAELDAILNEMLGDDGAHSILALAFRTPVQQYSTGYSLHAIFVGGSVCGCSAYWVLSSTDHPEDVTVGSWGGPSPF